MTPAPLTPADLAEPPSASSGTSGSNDLLSVEGGAGVHLDFKANLEKSLAFWEQTLRRKKTSSWKVQEMKMLLQLRGMDHTGRKAALQVRVKDLLFPADGEPSTPPLATEQPYVVFFFSVIHCVTWHDAYNQNSVTKNPTFINHSN